MEIAMTTYIHSITPKSEALRRWLLFTVEAIVAVNAVGGAMWGLDGARDVPREWLEGTPFDSYVVPSLILLIAVGGGMGTAAVALLLQRRRAAEFSIAAGLILISWITVQMLMIGPNGGVSWLQPTMLAAGLVVAALGWRLRRVRDMSGARSHVDSH
jgi:hypothetical protein